VAAHSWKDKGLEWRKIGKSFLLAVIVVFAAYLTLAFSDWAFKTDFRIWVFAIKPMSFFHFKIALAYFIPFAFYFLISGLVLHGQLRRGQKVALSHAGHVVGRGRDQGREADPPGEGIGSDGFIPLYGSRFTNF
jgi:hypothetical protein